MVGIVESKRRRAKCHFIHLVIKIIAGACVILLVGGLLLRIVFPSIAHDVRRKVQIVAQATLLRWSGTLAIGDSRLERSKLSMFCDGERYVNAGISGYTMEDMHFMSYILQTMSRPKRVVIELGINDANPSKQFDDTLFSTELNAMIRGFATHGAVVYVVSIVPNAVDGQYGGDYLVRQRIPEIQRIMHMSNAKYIDITDVMTDGNGNLRDELASDGLHFSDSGDAAWVKSVKANICG